MGDLVDGVGIDIGSTTVKVVAARGGAIVHRAYRRHRGRCLEEARALLAEAERRAGRGRRITTGSAGAALAEPLDASWVHEVHAVAAAARHAIPGARTIVELGGQDAKMIHLDEAGGLSSDMNERCAAGTGAVLDRCLHRLGLTERALVELELGDGPLPVVSAKCGVFAEADLVNLVKAGHPVEQVLAALLDALVRQNLTGLARGRPLPGPVVLLGGPHAFIPGLSALWRRHLFARWRERGVEPSTVVVPEHAALFAAHGALLSWEAVAQVTSARRRARLPQPHAARRKDRPGLGADSSFDTVRVKPPVPAGAGPLWLGLDAGSTTLKAVVLDAHDAPVATVYRKAAGNPLEDVKAVLAEVTELLGPRGAQVRALGVTGYAADLIGPVLGADATPVETLAHARSARRFVPDADVVCDVGGQDIKVLALASEGDGVLTFRLSHQCAAGNGVLLEATASELGVPLDRFAELACSAQRAPEFSVGCAVFLDTERVTAQRDGYSPAEILAGVTAVLPRNIWQTVAAETHLPALGKVFVLSGGVQRNGAAVKAQVDYLRARHPAVRVVVHPFAGEAGAIGAALSARESVQERPSRFIGFERAAAQRWSARSDEATRCHTCSSACARTVVSAQHATSAQPVQLVTGHGCERGSSLGPPPPATVRRGQDLLRVESSRLFARARRVQVVSQLGQRLRVAIPRVLAMYRAGPLFTHYFEALGVPRSAIVTGEASSEALWRRAAGRGTVDACYPAKLAQAHVVELLARNAERPIDALFFPVLTHAATPVTGCVDTMACPVVAGTPLVTRAAFGVGADDRFPEGPRLLMPTIKLTDRMQLSEALFRSVRVLLPALTPVEHDAALAEGFAAQVEFEAALERAGQVVLRQATNAQRCAVVVLGRPYHADPGIHHHLGAELAALGRSTMSVRALPRHAGECGETHELKDEAPFLTNSGDGEKLAGARFVVLHNYLVAIDVSSFKCGQDASLYGAVADISRAGSKPFLALHDLDETRPVASLRLRLRTFLDAVERWEKRVAGLERRPA